MDKARETTPRAYTMRDVRTVTTEGSHSGALCVFGHFGYMPGRGRFDTISTTPDRHSNALTNYSRISCTRERGVHPGNCSSGRHVAVGPAERPTHGMCISVFAVRREEYKLSSPLAREADTAHRCAHYTSRRNTTTEGKGRFPWNARGKVCGYRCAQGVLYRIIKTDVMKRAHR